MSQGKKTAPGSFFDMQPPTGYPRMPQGFKMQMGMPGQMPMSRGPMPQQFQLLQQQKQQQQQQQQQHQYNTQVAPSSTNTQQRFVLPKAQHANNAPLPSGDSSSEELEDTLSDAPKGTLCDDYDKAVRPKIDLVDKLRRLGLDKDVDLPSIVVVGDQSAGKSSVLEAISGVQLPRGKDIVTRCPLELRMKKSSKVQWEGCVKYREQIDNLESHDDVEDAVRSAQNALAGHGKDISKELITLEVASPEMPDLTLVDLPGITRVAVGDQNPAVVGQIKGIIQQQIEKQNTIILAVVPANVDIATSEALQMAEQVDPEGERTLGVITKTDLLPHGEESKMIAILNNESYKLKKGFVAVQCRNQNAVQRNTSLEEALQSEENAFAGSFLSEFLETRQCGIRSLSKRLANELSNHIQKTLPSLKHDIYNRLEDTRDKVGKMGESVPDDNAEKRRFLIKMLHDYTDDLKKLADGHEDGIPTAYRLHSVSKTIYENFAIEIQKKVPQKRGSHTNEIYKDFIKYIQQQIQEDVGRALPLFVKFETFRRIVWGIVQKFIHPAQECFKEVKTIVQKRLGSLATSKFSKFPKLETMVKNMVNNVTLVMDERGSAAITEFFELEKIVFSQGQTYLAAVENVSSDKHATSFGGAQHRPSFTDQQADKKAEAEFMFTQIQAYLEICVLRVADIVPMLVTRHAIMCMVEELREKVNGLVSLENQAVDALEENEDERRRRKQLKARLDRLEKAKVELEQMY